MFNLFNTRNEQSKLDTAKAIMRGCPPYMFKSNYEQPKANKTGLIMACASLGCALLSCGIF